MEKVQNKKFLGISTKYRSLLLFITLFVTVIVGVLTMNFIITAQFGSDANEINVAGRQRMLSQRIAKSIQNMILAQQNQNDYQQQKNELK